MYSPKVRVGHWVDRLQLELEALKIAEQKRAKGELPRQRLLRLKYAFNRPVCLPPRREPADLVKIGQHVQLLAVEIADQSDRLAAGNCPDEVLPGSPPRRGLLLSASVSPDMTDDIADGCLVGCSPALGKPAARNVFVIESAGPGAGQKYLTFGQQFYLQLAELSGTRLYLRSETPLIDGVFGPNHHNLLRLDSRRDCYAKWKALHWNKQQRFDTDGLSVPPCMRLVIQHVMTGKCLAVESSNWYLSLLGYECGASVHTYSDVHRSETSRCIWSFLACHS